MLPSSLAPMLVLTTLRLALYQPYLAPVGLLLAVLGNVLGTYLGLLVAQILSGMGP